MDIDLIIVAIYSYLLGSIPFGLLLTRIFLKKDSEKHFPSNGEASLSGVIVDCDVKTGLANNIKTFIYGGDLVNTH